jgi:hypothetical protein
MSVRVWQREPNGRVRSAGPLDAVARLADAELAVRLLEGDLSRQRDKLTRAGARRDLWRVVGPVRTNPPHRRGGRLVWRVVRAATPGRGTRRPFRLPAAPDPRRRPWHLDRAQRGAGPDGTAHATLTQPKKRRRRASAGGDLPGSASAGEPRDREVEAARGGLRAAATVRGSLRASGAPAVDSGGSAEPSPDWGQRRIAWERRRGSTCRAAAAAAAARRARVGTGVRRLLASRRRPLHPPLLVAGITR